MEEDKNSNDEYERRIRFIHGLSPYWNKPGIYVKYDKENQEFLNKLKKFKEALENYSREREEQTNVDSMLEEYQNLMKRIMKK